MLSCDAFPVVAVRESCRFTHGRFNVFVGRSRWLG